MPTDIMHSPRSPGRFPVHAMAALLLALSLSLAACGKGHEMVVIPQDAHSLEQFSLGLRFKQQGRYLLAREHFELARATARDSDLARRCDAEIAAMDRAIRELR